MAKAINKYYELYIKPNDSRRQELDALYQSYTSEKEQANEEPRKKMNWRGDILSQWFAEESDEVKSHVERCRREEMVRDVDQDPLPGDDEEEKRMKRARKIEK